MEVVEGEMEADISCARVERVGTESLTVVVEQAVSKKNSGVKRQSFRTNTGPTFLVKLMSMKAKVMDQKILLRDLVVLGGFNSYRTFMFGKYTFI